MKFAKYKFFSGYILFTILLSQRWAVVPVLWICHYDHIYSKTLCKCFLPCAVTKIRVFTTASMRVSWWATPARAQTERFARQRPTNKCFHIYPPPLFGTVEGLNGKQGCGSGGSLSSIGKPVFEPLCCWISWLCVPLLSLVHILHISHIEIKSVKSCLEL